MCESRKDRGLTQKIFLLEHSAAADRFQYKVEGTTGRRYDISLSFPSSRRIVQSCSCPDFAKRASICKHIYFIIHRVLHINADTSPKIADLKRAATDYAANVCMPDKDKQKLEDGDDCPICYEPMLRADPDVIFCSLQCGKSVHRECFRRWAALKNVPTCVYCRGNMPLT